MDGEHRGQRGSGPGTLSPGRRFDTWDVDHPTALVHLPSGLRVHVCAFSARAGAFTRFPAGEGIRLGPRTLDGSAVHLAVTHEGTELGLRFERTGPDAARVCWRTVRNGEWGLRFWVVVVLEPATPGSGDARPRVRWESGPSGSGGLVGRWRSVGPGPGPGLGPGPGPGPGPGLGPGPDEGWRPVGSVCALGARPPLLTTSHADLAALEREYETHGYWYLASRGTAGPLVALRYNLEETPEHCLAVGVGPGETDAARVVERARDALRGDVPGGSHGPAVERTRDAHGPASADEAPSPPGADDDPRGPAERPEMVQALGTVQPSETAERPGTALPSGKAPAAGAGDLPGPEGPETPAASPGTSGGTRAPAASPGRPDPTPDDGSGPPSSSAPPSPVSASRHGQGPAAAWSSSRSPPPLHTGRYEGALDAVRDVIGWNTVHDPVNRRPYTALSRTWSSRKFGGFGVWLDDVLYHALLAGTLDLELAEENLRAVLAGRTEAGNLPCLLTGRDAWVDRSQPPVGAFVVWLLHQRWGERRLLEETFETLLDNHEWWWRERDGNRNGLLEYGTSPVGDGLYRGTALAARNESSMDNSPVHDEAVLVPESHTLDCEDVGLNSLLALDGEMLALAAAELGRDDEARRLGARARGLAGRIGEALWDPEREVFANRLWSGRFVASIAPTSFYPLLAGAASPAQARALLGWLGDPRRFGGRFVLPSVSRDDPACGDNVYWRGRVWPPLNFLVYQGLRRYGFAAEASALAGRSFETFAGPWREARQCAENYGARDGAVTDQPDTDTFYGWGALMPALAVAEVCDVSPWDGWSVVHTGEDVRLGPLRCPPGSARVEARSGVLALRLNDGPVLRTNVRGRLRHLRWEPGLLGLELPPLRSAPGAPPGEPPWLELPGVPAEAVTGVRLEGAGDEASADGGPVVGPGSGGGVRVTLPARSCPSELTLAWRSAPGDRP